MDALMETSFAWTRAGIKAALIFLAFYLISRLVVRVFSGVTAHASEGRRDIIALAGKTSVIAILVIGALTALSSAKIVDVMPLVTSLGLTGFALGFAFKDVLSNLLAGAMILFYRPFRLGSRINVSNFEGVVTSIDLRYTILKNSGKRFLIPNSTLLSNVITISDEEAR